MAFITVSLPSLILTSSAVDTSTQTITAVDVSDTYRFSAWVNGNTTAPGIQAQVSLTTDSAAIFVPLTFPSSGASVVYLTSALTVVPTMVFKQLRVGTTNVTSTSYTIIMTKQIEV